MPIRTTAPRRPPRRTHITDHSGEEMYRLLYGALPTGTQLPATQRNMLGLPGAHAAVSKIANNAAHMLLEATVEGAATRPQVVSDPCTEYDPFTFWKTLLATAMCRGNAIGVRHHARFRTCLNERSHLFSMPPFACRFVLFVRHEEPGTPAAGTGAISTE